MIRLLVVLLLSAAPICWSHAAPHKNRVEKPSLSLAQLTQELTGVSPQRQRVEPWFRIKSAKGPMGWIPSHGAWPALSFARYAAVSPSTRLYAKPGELPVRNLLKQIKTVAVLSSRPPWFEVQLGPKEKVWAAFEDLKALPQDLGFGYLLRTQRVPTDGGTLKIDRGTRFHPVALKGSSLVQVKIIEGPHADKILWLPRNVTLSKLNFAETVQLEEDSSSQESTAARKILRITTPTRWLMNGRSSQPLYAEPKESAKVMFEIPPSSPMALVESDWQIWELSPSMIYGTRWSLKHSVQLTTPQSQSQLTSAEVFSRPIFDMSSSPKSAPPMTVLSAGGVYLRHGKGPWYKLDNFGEMNLPVSITGTGDILVADQISEDQGQTFRSLMAWDKVMAALPEMIRTEVTPRVLKIQTLDPLGKHLLYHLDFGNGHLAVAETKNQGASWKVRPL